MIFECTNCFNRPKSSRLCELCGLMCVYAVSAEVIDTTLLERLDPEYLEAEWLAKVRRMDSKCTYCGEDVRKEQPGLLAFHILTKDHVIPISRGGLDILWNIVPCCLRCNRMKGNRTAFEFLKGRYGLCKCANLRREFQQVLFSYIEGVAASKLIDRQPISLRKRPQASSLPQLQSKIGGSHV